MGEAREQGIPLARPTIARGARFYLRFAFSSLDGGAADVHEVGLTNPTVFRPY